MVKSNLNFTWQELNQEKGILYEYFRHYLSNQSPTEVLDEFRCLFIEGRSKQPNAREALEKIVFSQQGQEKFDYIINHCCHIIINAWSNQPEFQEFIPRLIDIFNSVNPQINYYDRRKKRLLQLVCDFKSTEQYLKLTRLVELLNSSQTIDLQNYKNVGDLAKRYFYLYKHLLLGDEQSQAEKKLIREIQKNNQKYFEFQLSQHIIYRARLVQIARARQISQGAGKIIRRVNNPTLLSEKDLKIAIKQYMGKVNQEGTIWQSAQKFLTENKFRRSYKEYHRDLYHYLIDSVSSKQEDYQFANKLKQIFKQIKSPSNSPELTDVAMLSTCRQLLRYLVAATYKEPEHYQFIELIKYLGTVQTITLLIKIILICPQAKPDLEKRFAILFTHYQSYKLTEVPWLVKSLEHLLIVFSIYFGKIDLSIAKII
ncbi:hypothetical protein STA3757_16110 [Stanieria sp. NIES-3757]|nr:hypothetical protein STA3757_16110 [Stanieria sp. NIES-3757]